jgi:hypothetical protein
MGDHHEPPHLLLWYVTGDLDPRQARETEAHLAVCADCSAEARALASMLESLRRDAPGGLLAPSRQPGPSGVASIPPGTTGRHGSRDEPRSRSSRWTIRCLKAAAIVAAGLAVLAASALLSRWILSPVPLTIREVQTVIFTSPESESVGDRILPGDGPWAITAVLPPGAPEGSYRMRIEMEDRPADASGQEVILSTDGQGRVSVVLDSLPEPGRYLMIVNPLEDGSGSPAVFRFTTGMESGPTPER